MLMPLWGKDRKAVARLRSRTTYTATQCQVVPPIACDTVGTRYALSKVALTAWECTGARCVLSMAALLTFAEQAGCFVDVFVAAA